MKSILACLILLLAAQPVFSQKSKQLEQLFNAYDKIGGFSGSVLVTEKGKIIFEKSYGYRNGPKKEKNTNNSLYRVFSTTKMFTATVILKLEEEGKLSLNDKLSKYYPNFPKGDNITIANLLSHTSGIPDETSSENTVNEEILMKFLASKPLDFSPGTQWNYSNSGYYILGHIIKKVTGTDYDKAIENYILKPLQMNNSGFHFNEVTDENKAWGYEFLSDKMSNEALRFKTDHPFAAGAMYSTVGDIFKFNEAFKNYKILKKETVEKMITPYLNDHYGFGCDTSIINGKKRIGHDGGGPGYRSRYYRIPEDDICVIVQSNYNLSFTEMIVPQIEDILYNRPYSLPTTKNINLKELKKLEGAYIVDGTKYYINIIDGQVILNGGNYARLPLLPTTNTKLQFSEKFTFTFQPDKTRKIENITIHFFDGSIKKGKKTNATPVWGIIGNATPAGWGETDIPLQTDPQKPNIYFLKNYKMKKGGFKFRCDNRWGYNFGLNNDGKSIAIEAYDFQIEEDGMYDIIFDMTNKMIPQYSIKKSVL